MPRRIADRWLSAQEVEERALDRDPVLREAWYATMVATAVATAMVKYRYDRQLTQTDLGRRLGMTQSQIARIEIGEHTPTLDTLCRICDALGLEMELRIGPREEGKRAVPKTLQKGVHDASDQVIVSIRERSGTA